MLHLGSHTGSVLSQFVYVFLVCVCTCMCVEGASVFMYMWKTTEVSHRFHFPGTVTFFFFETESLAGLEIANESRVVGQ